MYAYMDLILGINGHGRHCWPQIFLLPPHFEWSHVIQESTIKYWSTGLWHHIGCKLGQATSHFSPLRMEAIIQNFSHLPVMFFELR